MARLVILLSSILLLVSCKKESQSEAQTGTVVLRLIDSPGSYDHVYIDIQNVEVNLSGTGWVDIGPQIPGVYDLLAYNNGIDTLLANATIPVGNITQIRLSLGSQNTIVVGGTTYSLSTPSAQQSGLKINVSFSVAENQVHVYWIDFDAGKSIIALPNNNYQLKPVLRCFDASQNAIIKGFVLPAAALPYVEAISATDTLTAIPNGNGFYQISGVPGGTYEVRLIPGNTSYTGQTIYGQTVGGSNVLDLGTVTLQ